MKITKQSYGYVLESGIQVTVFSKARFEKSSIPDVELLDWHSDESVSTIPNQHIKEFTEAFEKAGGVIE